MSTRMIAYFSMEVALRDEIPTFSGGLGVLAGDFLRAAADAGTPMVGVTLVYHRGFFRQEVDEQGRQLEYPVRWSPADLLERLDARAEITIGGRVVEVGVWRHVLTGIDGATVPVYFLDTRLAGNDRDAQTITDQLYPGYAVERLSQEAVLGLAAPSLLRQLGHVNITTYHLNEGHAALVPVALLTERAKASAKEPSRRDVESIRDRCVFTTHTPVPAGHDRFKPEVMRQVLGDDLVGTLTRLRCLERGVLNMTVLGMFFSGFINGVALRHGEVSRAMFPKYRIDAITNGVHVPTWVAPSTARLFDWHLHRWRHDNTMLRYACGIPLDEIRDAHDQAKKVMIEEVSARHETSLDPGALTIGVARRAAAYKRNDLLLSQPERLRQIVERVGPLQVVYSGKAHPRDAAGKEVIERVHAAGRALDGAVTVTYLEDYGISLAALLVAGVDVWLNTPVAPHEASGTSGMKAALNGVPSLSILDGWWIEGHVEGVTGWAVGTDPGVGTERTVGDPEVDAADESDLLQVLGEVVAPCFYAEDPDEFAAIRRSAMALNGSFFTSQRMLGEYTTRAYSEVERLDA